MCVCVFLLLLPSNQRLLLLLLLLLPDVASMLFPRKKGGKNERYENKKKKDADQDWRPILHNALPQGIKLSPSLNLSPIVLPCHRMEERSDTVFGCYPVDIGRDIYCTVYVNFSLWVGGRGGCPSSLRTKTGVFVSTSKCVNQCCQVFQ